MENVDGRTLALKVAQPATVAGSVISAWEDDPGPAILMTRPVPDLKKQPLAFAFAGNRPPLPGIYKPGTAAFRYWTAAEALRRGADFWCPAVPGGTWEVGPTLKVILDEGQDLNAYYDRKALNFFHGPGVGGTVYSGESPDIVCHEMGHAILDAIKPQLWDVASQEVAAFHESFADISAILSALQVQSLRVAILADTQGRLYRNSRLSRLAEQLGAAIRLQAPDAVDPDCLRNAVNSFTYQDAAHLPQMAPAAQLSSEPHSFSRVFTGAFFEVLAGMLATRAADPGALTEQDLAAVSIEIRDIVVAAVIAAPVVPNWYAQVAAAMIDACATVNAAYPAIARAVFVRRSILSLPSAVMVGALSASVPQRAQAEAPGGPGLASMAIPAGNYGLAQPIVVEVASHHRRFVASSAGLHGSASLEPASSATAAQAFVDDLFSRGRVDYGNVGPKQPHFDHGRRLRSHVLVAEGDAIRLRRCLCDCGLAL